ncbi:MAG: DNA translocase FtsK [Candidatus Gracilibacteria bacterium]|nr:DNA translocase FtsK [Candidatus Gracilibacteria bacterium]
MARKKKKQNNSFKNFLIEHKDKIIAVVLLFFGVISIAIDLNSPFGALLDYLLQFLFGAYYGFIFTPAVLALGILLLIKQEVEFNSFRVVGLLFYFTALTSLIGGFNSDNTELFLGFFNQYPVLSQFFGGSVAIIILVVLLGVSLILAFKFSFSAFFSSVKEKIPDSNEIKENIKKEFATNNSSNNSKKTVNKKDDLKLSKAQEKLLKQKMKELDKQKAELEKEKKKSAQMQLSDAPRKVKIEKKSPEKKGLFGAKKSDKLKQQKLIQDPDYSDWSLPSVDLLKDRLSQNTITDYELEEKKQEIKEKLEEFNISVRMTGHNIGPTVTQYRLKPKEGVKLSKITNLKKDLTLALMAESIRIQAPIPGAGVVGIEVPNEQRDIVGMKEILESKEFNNPRAKIPIILGKDVSGKAIVGDLTKMPHLLVAGQTASGKSVGMNAFLISMLYKFSPSELKFIMVDPKRVELSIYNNIPHLLSPVITNPDKATNALKWCVAEMLRRYDLQVEKNARNIEEYNKKVSKKEKLPYIVMVIDELADLMMSGNKKEVENSIARIAQMARAVGMHLIVATQRPSVDVITGLIKANIPSRIAFTVASQVDSRTVIDKAGAEDLLGMGDMLYYPTGAMAPERVQGVYVSTDEVENVVNKIKLTIDPNAVANTYDQSIVNGKSKFEGSVMEGLEGQYDEDPELIEKAIEVVKQMKKGSTSLIQRKLGLGYARAAKILDILEELGVVGPANGSKPREVYLD